MQPDDPRHGSDAGYQAHLRSKIPACPTCSKAHMVANKRRRLGWGGKVPALGSQRRIQALQALGWSRKLIAQHMGYSDQGSIAYLMRAETVTSNVAAKIIRTYDALSMTAPDGPGVGRAKTWAKRFGYLPPLAWDDDHIDDPKFTPTPHKTTSYRNDVDKIAVIRFLEGDREVPTTRAERELIVREFLRLGIPLAECERAGWKPERYAS